MLKLFRNGNDPVKAKLKKDECKAVLTIGFDAKGISQMGASDLKEKLAGFIAEGSTENAFWSCNSELEKDTRMAQDLTDTQPAPKQSLPAARTAQAISEAAGQNAAISKNKRKATESASRPSSANAPPSTNSNLSPLIAGKLKAAVTGPKKKSRQQQNVKKVQRPNAAVRNSSQKKG